MKLYVGTKKKGKICLYSMALYSNEGKIIYSVSKQSSLQNHKFYDAIRSLRWAVHKVKVLLGRNAIDPTEKINVFISSKTLYRWIEKEMAPSPYTVVFSELCLDLAFIYNPVELFYSENVDKKLRYIKPREEKLVKVTDMFASMGVDFPVRQVEPVLEGSFMITEDVMEEELEEVYEEVVALPTAEGVWQQGYQ